MDINQLQREISNPKLRAKLEELMKSPEGKNLEQALKNTDQRKMQQYIKMLESKNIPTDAVLKQLQNNPDIIKKISEILNKK